MNLDEAIERFEDICGVEKDEALPDKGALEICSGGLRKDADECSPPALYLDQDDAIFAWYVSVSDACVERDAQTYRFVKSPSLDKFQITVQDGRGSHRIVANRYAVTSTIAFGA